MSVGGGFLLLWSPWQARAVASHQSFPHRGDRLPARPPYQRMPRASSSAARSSALAGVELTSRSEMAGPPVGLRRSAQAAAPPRGRAQVPGRCRASTAARASAHPSRPAAPRPGPDVLLHEHLARPHWQGPTEPDVRESEVEPRCQAGAGRRPRESGADARRRGRGVQRRHQHGRRQPTAPAERGPYGPPGSRAA